MTKKTLIEMMNDSIAEEEAMNKPMPIESIHRILNDKYYDWRGGHDIYALFRNTIQKDLDIYAEHLEELDANSRRMYDDSRIYLQAINAQ